VLTPALFDGDLSSLRELCLESVRTQLPWRNMANLTSFTLCRTSPGGATVRQILDFFKSAPLLREVNFYSATPTSSDRDCKLVSLACLKRMRITGGGSASLLLDHLLIPIGTRMTIVTDFPNSSIDDNPPSFLHNLRNLPNFTEIESCNGPGPCSYMDFSGPNGKVRMYANDRIRLVLESLNHFDTSKTEYLQIAGGKSLSSDPPYRTLLPMKHLRALTLYQFKGSHIFIRALHPSGVVVCPKLEDLWIQLYEETLDLKDVIGMAVARASRGAKLKSITIHQDNYVRTDVLELRKHVLHVDCGPEFKIDDDGDDVDEGD
jgi:hypothetical protein